MGMRHQVRFVEDGALPEGREWALVRTPRTAYLFVKQSAINTETGRCAALERAWAIYQAATASSVELEQAAG